MPRDVKEAQAIRGFPCFPTFCEEWQDWLCCPQSLCRNCKMASFQTVTLLLTLKNCANERLSQTVCARILSQNAAFVPRSPLQPYSMRPATVVCCIGLVLASSSHPEVIVLKPLLGRSKICKPLFENCAGNTENWLENLRRN